VSHTPLWEPSACIANMLICAVWLLNTGYLCTITQCCQLVVGYNYIAVLQHITNEKHYEKNYDDDHYKCQTRLLY